MTTVNEVVGLVGVSLTLTLIGSELTANIRVATSIEHEKCILVDENPGSVMVFIAFYRVLSRQEELK